MYILSVMLLYKNNLKYSRGMTTSHKFSNMASVSYSKLSVV